MGVYLYAVSKKAIKTEIGPVNTSYFVCKDRHSHLGLNPARINRVDKLFATAPDFIVFGNPKDVYFRKLAARTGKPVEFTVLDNRVHRSVVLNDSIIKHPIVGTLLVDGAGKLEFCKL